MIRQQKGWAMLSHPCKYTQVCLCRGEAKPTRNDVCLGFVALCLLYITRADLCSGCHHSLGSLKVELWPLREMALRATARVPTLTMITIPGTS